MKRKYLSIILSCALLLSLVGVGCSKEEQGTPSDNSANVSNQEQDIDETETTIETEELTDLPFDNSKPEYVVAYFVNKLTTIDSVDNYDMNDIIIPSKIKETPDNSNYAYLNSYDTSRDLDNIVKWFFDDKENTNIKYSYDDFVIYRDVVFEEMYNTHAENVPFNVYLIMCKQEESNFFMQVHVSEPDTDGNCFLIFHCDRDSDLKYYIKDTITYPDGLMMGASGGTKADLIKQWEDEGNIVKVSLDEFM